MADAGQVDLHGG